MISVSYLKSKFSKEETIKKIDGSIADMIHVDLMDGEYVNNRNLDTIDIYNDFLDAKKPLDVHLMTNFPSNYIRDFAKLNTKTITFHLDSKENPKEVIELIKDYNILVGIAINPNDDIHIIDGYLDIIDYCLIMSVNPGMGGQTFQKEVISKIEYLQNKDILIGIDGGINDTTIKYLKDYKIDNIVSGSFICMSDDFNKQISLLNNK